MQKPAHFWKNETAAGKKSTTAVNVVSQQVTAKACEEWYQGILKSAVYFFSPLHNQHEKLFTTIFLFSMHLIIFM